MTRWSAEVNRGCHCCEQDRLFKWAAEHGILYSPNSAPVAGINLIIAYIKDLEKRAGVQPPAVARRENIRQQVSGHQSRYSRGWVTCSCGWDPATVISRRTSYLKDAYRALDTHRKEEAQDNE